VRVPYEGGEAEDVTPEMPRYALAALSLSRDGRHIAITTATRDGFRTYVSDLGERGEIGAWREIFHTAALMRGAHLSPDGSMAVLGLTERSKSTDVDLAAVDARHGERIGALYDEGASVSAVRFSRVAGDERLLCSTTRSGAGRPFWHPRTGERTDLPFDDAAGDVLPVDWSEDGDRLLLMQVSEAVQRLAVYDLRSSKLAWLEHPGGMIFSAHFGQDAEILALMSDSTRAARVVALDDATGLERRALLAGEDAPAGAQWRSVSYASTEGARIQAWLATPPGAGPFPTILETHGGPSGVTLDQYVPRTQAWVDHGFAVLSINYRGSITFGSEFQKCINGDLGHWEADDMAAAHTWLIENEIAAAGQVFLTGWSYGGYLTLLALGKLPKLWAGGMAGVAIADWVLMFEDQAETLRRTQAALFGGTPAELPEQHARSSPITYADRVRAPALVIQGSNDTRCPPRQMRAYEEKMLELGKRIEVQWFEAGHGSYAAEQQIDHQQRMMEFAAGVLRAGERREAHADV
jgi:dipeptidyl aminopeptidase/acylaminoacyl peptidase